MKAIGLTLGLALGLQGLAPALAAEPPPAVPAPDPERWELQPRGVQSPPGLCSAATDSGEIWCAWRRRGLWRRLSSALRRGPPAYLWVRVQPSFCPWSDARRYALAWLQSQGTRWRKDERLELPEPADGTLVGRTPTRRLAWVAAERDLIWIDMHVPSGVGPDEESDFASVLASAREAGGRPDAARRGLWLSEHITAPPIQTNPLVCEISKHQWLELRMEALREATRDEPEDWRAWRALASAIEEQAGGPEIPEWRMTGTGLEHPADPLQQHYKEELGPQPYDTRLMRSAAVLYGEAARRLPEERRRSRRRAAPAPPLSDRESLLARQAQCVMNAGDPVTASEIYARVLSEGDLERYGYVEAILWHAEQAYRADDPPRAKQLYQHAERAWTAYARTRSPLSGIDVRIGYQIERRLKELADVEPRRGRLGFETGDSTGAP